MITQEPIHVKIAEFILALIVPKDVPFVLDGGFEGYVTVLSAQCSVLSAQCSVLETETERETERERSAAAEERVRERSAFAEASADERSDLRIYCHVGCANAPKIWGKELYCARNGEHALWTIYEADGGICIHVNDSEELTRLQHIAFYQEEKQEWTIYSDLNENQELESLRYPMLPLILYYLTTKTESLLVHASGVFDGEHGRIFSGFSGVGKSTMAELWQGAGARVINDDRLILRKLDGRWWMFNTPMYYTDVPKKAPLDFIYLPFHHPENTYERGNGIQITMRFMAHCIQHGYNAAHVQWHLNQLMDISTEIPITRLGVVPNAEVLTFIKQHEQA